MKWKFRAGDVAAIVVLLAVALPLPVNGSLAGLASICPSWRLLHVPCLFCGMTRAFVCSAHGRFSEAFAYHPLGPLLFAATAVFAVMSFWRRDWRPSPKLAKIGGTFTVLALCVAWFLRLGGYWPLPTS